MPAFYLVNIAKGQMYFDFNRSRCRAPGSRPPGVCNTIYFTLDKAFSTLVLPEWDEGLDAFTFTQRMAGQLWLKDVTY